MKPKVNRKLRSPEQSQLLVVSGSDKWPDSEGMALSSFGKLRNRFEQLQASEELCGLTPATAEKQAPRHVELDFGDGLILGRSCEL